MTLAEFKKYLAICRIGGGGAGQPSSYVHAQSGASVVVSGVSEKTLLASIPVAGGVLGEHGAFRITALWSFTRSTNDKRMIIEYGGYTVLATNQNIPSYASVQVITIVRNRGVLNRQITTATGNAGIGGSQGEVTALGVDTAKENAIEFYASVADANDSVSLEGYTIEVLNP
ncbi:hypothetical protein [Burkholderia sp. AU45388]|uniref:hypothetical protein n=1 Tax=Burkholderia sp. AU45388 TaxID=3059206 RepID=UPI002652BE6A|nr:hypothetical protein [Burkholderia sp. AU45388]MDN7430518.1 hypothetical protein [Burkholderia sp. AU45388]